jgi:hypothetical protein
MVSPQLRMQVVVVMRAEVEVSERRACGLTQIHRGTYRYWRRPEDGRLRVLAEERRRFGYHQRVLGSGFLQVASCDGSRLLWPSRTVAPMGGRVLGARHELR